MNLVEEKATAHVHLGEQEEHKQRDQQGHVIYKEGEEKAQKRSKSRQLEGGPNATTIRAVEALNAMCWYYFGDGVFARGRAVKGRFRRK